MAKKRQETHFSRTQGEKKWIDDYVERATAGARNWVGDAEAAAQQEQEDMMNAENARLTNSEAEETFRERMVAIRDSLGDLASSDNGEDGEDVDNKET